jgi:chromosome segregation ATPase
MFSTLQNKIIALVIGLLIVSIISLIAIFKINQGQIALLKSDLASSEQSRENLQRDLTSITDQLEVAELDKIKLRDSLSLLAKTFSVREQQRGEIKADFAVSNKKLQQIFDGTTDEKTISWGTASIPDDVSRVLEQSARCANHYRNKDSLCIPSNGTHKQMFSSRIFQPNKPRTF